MNLVAAGCKVNFAIGILMRHRRLNQADHAGAGDDIASARIVIGTSNSVSRLSAARSG